MENYDQDQSAGAVSRFYKTDYIIEVPDEVAAVMKEHDRLEAAYRRRTYYHKAHYSLDRGDGIEL